MTIGDLCETISNTYRGKDREVVLVNTSDVLEGKVLNHQLVPNENLKGQFKKTFRKNDILYSEIRPANKRFAFVDFENTDCYIASTKLMVLRPKVELVDPRFLYAVLTSRTLVDEMQHQAETRSGTFPQITFSSELAPYSVNVPNLETQKKIVSLLDAIEQKVDTNKAINDNLQQQVMALYRQMFVETENVERIHCRADEFFDISIGKTPPRKEPQWFSNTPSDCVWVSISDMGSCGVFISDSSEYLTREAIKKHNVKLVPNNTVILSFKLTVGRVAITDGEMTTNEAIAHFKTTRPEINEYLYCYLSAFNYQTMGSTSSIATAVNSKIIKGMDFIVPTDEELCVFHEFASPMFEMIKHKQRENIELSTLRDSLLPKLMSGELDVSGIQL